MDVCTNYPENSSRTKIGENIPCGYSMSTIWAFNNIKNFISWGIFHGKVLSIFKRTGEKYNWFWKEKNVRINKRRIEITWRCKSMLHLWKKNLTKAH